MKHRHHTVGRGPSAGDGVRMKFSVIGKLRTIAAGLLLIFAAALQTPAQAQLPGSTPPVAPPALWRTAIKGVNAPPEYFPSPDQACRRQHDSFNPNATYEAPTYLNTVQYSCHWDGGGGAAPSAGHFDVSQWLGADSKHRRTSLCSPARRRRRMRLYGGRPAHIEHSSARRREPDLDCQRGQD